MQSQLEEAIPDAVITPLMLGETEALELSLVDNPNATHDMRLGRGPLELAEARRLIFSVGRNNWMIAALLIDSSESLDEDFITIASSFRFNGSSGNILSLSGSVSFDVPEEWFRYADYFSARNTRETIGVNGWTELEYCVASIDIIALDSPEFNFPEAGSNDDYLEAYLNGRDVVYEPLDIYAEHLAEGISLYMTETEDDYQYLSLQVLEESLVLGMTYLGEGYCIDDYFMMINSITEEQQD